MSLPDLTLAEGMTASATVRKIQAVKRDIQNLLSRDLEQYEHYVRALEDYKRLKAAGYSLFVESFNHVQAAKDFGRQFDEEDWAEFQERRRNLIQSVEWDLGFLVSVADALGQPGVIPSPTPPQPTYGDTVFIVHGHDTAKLSELELLLNKVAVKYVVLKDEPSGGRTVIEKFEDHAGEAGFAVALCTADDTGKAKSETRTNPRARQNVIFELGYFYGKLGRDRTAALKAKDVELPSDTAGVVTISLECEWRTELIKEMKAAGLPGKWENYFGK